MTEDYEYDYEQACKERRKENDGYIREFDNWLMAKGLSDKTIQRHIDNANFYINEYLLHEDAYRMEDGCYRIDDFLGRFFIRKCMWSTPATIKQGATSIKKFYRCMLDSGHITRESYDTLLATIKSDMPLWIEDCEAYNDPGANYFGDFLGSDSIDQDLFDTAYAAVAKSLGLDYLLGDDDSDMLDEDMDDMLSKEEAIDMLTMALLYLTSHRDKTRYASASMAPEVLCRLRERGWIDGPDLDRVTFLDDGEFVGEGFLAAFGFDYLSVDEEDDGPQAHGLRLVD